MAHRHTLSCLYDAGGGRLGCQKEQERPAARATGAPASGGLVLVMGEKRIPVASLEEASRKARQWIDDRKMGASEFASRGGAVVLEGATKIAEVSYNGKVWKPGPWKEGDVPLYAPGAGARRTEARASRCDVAALEAAVRKEIIGQAPESQRFMLVGLDVARFLARRRAPFLSIEVPLDPKTWVEFPDSKTPRHHVSEFLGVWSNPANIDPGSAYGPIMMLRLCPSLGERAKKLWKGY